MSSSCSLCLLARFLVSYFAVSCSLYLVPCYLLFIQRFLLFYIKFLFLSIFSWYLMFLFFFPETDFWCPGEGGATMDVAEDVLPQRQFGRDHLPAVRATLGQRGEGERFLGRSAPEQKASTTRTAARMPLYISPTKRKKCRLGRGYSVRLYTDSKTKRFFVFTAGVVTK